jgi:redox-sensitive bicupin YhaK (pirin superfamily)
MPPLEAHPGRPTPLGPLTVWRALPARGRRLIGPWCFLDRYGPLSFTDDKPMDVAPHPHIGIQTVSWLLEGEVIHHDTLGCEGLVRPGGVNVMTAGRGIAHAEETPRGNSGRLNGVQLWVALPEVYRHVVPAFQHVPEVPHLDGRGAIVRQFLGGDSPAATFSDVVGLDAAIHAGETWSFPLHSAREHGLFVTSGDAELEGQPLDVNTLYYLEPGHTELSVKSREGARLLLLGGTPFGEPVLMWWNFVARTPEEIAAARTDWEEGRFGEVTAYDGLRMHAPPLLKLARPNPAS